MALPHKKFDKALVVLDCVSIVGHLGSPGASSKDVSCLAINIDRHALLQEMKPNAFRVYEHLWVLLMTWTELDD